MFDHLLNNKKAVIIFSGGIDSTTLLYDILNQGFEVHALTFYYHQKHCKEIDCARNICAKLQIPHKILDLTILNDIAPSSLTRDNWVIPIGNYNDESMKQTVVPNRNMVMLSIAGSFAIGIGAPSLFYGAHSGDHTIYPDCRPVFVNAMQIAFHVCDWQDLLLYVPFLHLSKADIITRGIKLGVPYEMTWTCYKGGEKPCGECGSCSERKRAFQEVGVSDPLTRGY